jgi:hypothetical protein
MVMLNSSGNAGAMPTAKAFGIGAGQRNLKE